MGFPIEVKEGKQVTIEGKIPLSKPILSGFGLKAKLMLNDNQDLCKMMNETCTFSIDDMLLWPTRDQCNSLMPKGQSCSTPLLPGIYAETKQTFTIPKLSSEILADLNLYKSLTIELTLTDSKSKDLACLRTKIEWNDGEKNSGMKMFNSNLMMGAMLLMVF